MALILLQDAPTKSDGTAPAGGAPAGMQPGGALGSMGMFLPLILVMIVMFFMSSRRNKKEAEARKAMKKGEKVLSQSGIVGELVDIDDRFAKVKIAPGTTVQMLATAISPLPDAAPAADKPSALADLKEAKASAGDKK
jgi:preprotein translocase subunit YajC